MLETLDEKPYEIDKIRLFDFYLAAPGALKIFRTTTREVIKRKKDILKSLSIYDEIENAKSLFFDVQTIQTTVLKHLAAKGAISMAEYNNNYVSLNADFDTDNSVASLILKNKSIIGDVMTLIEEDLQSLPFLGDGGLKDRSNLMEYRYDIS